MKGYKLIILFVLIWNSTKVFSQSIDTEKYYYLWNIYQGEGMVIAKSNEGEQAIMVQRLNYDGALLQFESVENGFFYIKNVALNTNGYLYTEKEKGNRLYFSQKKNASEYMWKLVKKESGLIIINKQLGNNFVVDCDSDVTGSILFMSENTGAFGQFWVASNVKKLPIVITSIRMFQDNKIIVQDYSSSVSETIRRILESKGKLRLNDAVTPTITITAPYNIVMEYVKNNEIYTKKYSYGDVINLEAL